MYQKNELKNLIYIQENKSCDKQTLKGLFRAIVEPVLQSNAEGIVLLRLENESKQEFESILKRLEYSKSKVFDFSDTAISGNFQNVLKDNIWNKTEFVYVLTERFGASFVFDYEESEIDDFAQYYLMYNSKVLVDSFEIINANSIEDLSIYNEKWHPDRRDNELLNLSIRKIVENLKETNQEALFSQYETQICEEPVDLASRLEFLQAKSSYLSHELRNLMSICNLYSSIIEKQEKHIFISDKDAAKSIFNARGCIRKTFMMIDNLLLDFKSLKPTDLREYCLNSLIDSAFELTNVYSNSKNIKFKNRIKDDVTVLVDENKFLTVLINLIKNAVESINESGEISVDIKPEDENVKVIVANNGEPIKKEVQSNIFQEGFTTKSTGSGLGLVICKKTLEEQFAQLKLLKSDEVSTEFEITVLKGGV